MAHLIAISGSLVLFFGFVGITALERKRGARFFVSQREKLDQVTLHITKSLLSVDPLDFVVRGARVVFAHVIHDIANVLWAVVRMLERTLAGVVYRLRHLRKTDQRTETNSSFVKSISSHKQTLRAPEEVMEEKTENTVG
jgi:hypothetical protein